MNVHPSDFKLIAELLKKRSGLNLNEDKSYLIESRLMPVARAHHMQDLSQLCDAIRANANAPIVTEIIEAMTTNESSFFRDNKPFEQLRQTILPMVMRDRAATRKLRIWSAASSTGQEPYTISMCLKDNTAKMAGWQVDIQASDLAQKVVDRAKQGIFTQFEAQRGLPIQLLIKYFTQLPDTNWQLKDEIRNTVKFFQFNLLDDYGRLGKFDIIFCRNVLIYFDDNDKKRVAEKMASALTPKGILILGSTETLQDAKGQFTAMTELRGAYQLKS